MADPEDSVDGSPQPDSSAQPESSAQPDTSAPADPSAAPITANEPTSASESAAPGEAAPRKDPRPKPAYGEYAPEGWEWKPEESGPESGGSSASGAGVGAHGRSAHGAGSYGGVAGGSSVPQSLPGVPHNLGVGASLPARRGTPYVAEPDGRSSQAPSPNSQASQPGQNSPSASAAPSGQAQSGPAPQAGAPYRGGPYQGTAQPAAQLPAAQQKPRRTADRVITILLLAFGAVGALQYAFTLFNLDKQFAVVGQMLGLDTVSISEGAVLAGQIGGIVILAFYGVLLVYSIRRLRSGKLTFWVPLVAGVVVFIVVAIITAGAMYSSPEIVEVLSDPEKSSQLLEQALNGSTSS